MQSSLRTLAAALSLLAVSYTEGAAQGTPVTTCGQLITGSAYLPGDLDCSAALGDAVIIDGGRLDLAGFTLTGSNLVGNAVTCVGSCTIFSSALGGSLVDGEQVIVDTADSGAPVTIENVELDGLGTVAIGVNAYGSKLTITNVAIHDVQEATISRRIKMEGCTVTNASEEGVVATQVKIFNSQIVNTTNSVAGSGQVRSTMVTGGGGYGVAMTKGRIVDSAITGKADSGLMKGPFGSVRVSGSDISGNARNGIDAMFAIGRLTIDATTISNNAANGIEFTEAVVRIKENSQITGNARNGIKGGPTFAGQCGKLSLKDSVATGNGFDANCGVGETCADLTTCDDPATLIYAICDNSYDSNSGFPGTTWGVCALD